MKTKYEMKEVLNIVTEVGTFGDLDIPDPTIKEIANKNQGMTDEELQEIIKQSIQENAKLVKLL